MRVAELCEVGKFTSIFVEGSILPTYDTVGIEIGDGETLQESLKKSKTYRTGISKLRLNIVGETPNDRDVQKDLYRDRLGLKERVAGNNKRYCIGYVDIITIRDNNITVSNVEQDAYRLAKAPDEAELLTQAIKVKNEIARDMEFTTNYSVAIVDKLYVNKYFRCMGVSTWIHNNIRELVLVYGLTNISAVVLIPGDFSKEATSEFHMSDKEYDDMLERHYKSLGYSFISRSVMCKRFVSKPTKYLIGFDK